ncbi:hypothetical protein BLGI_2564 [Brevibacillus laterosporus GI-9]|nr:hypothetical protein BLGI_2564 [Brevibacillus laterosporus GI-9]
MKASWGPLLTTVCPLYCHSLEEVRFYKISFLKNNCNFSFFILDLVCEQEK